MIIEHDRDLKNFPVSRSQQGQNQTASESGFIFGKYESDEEEEEEEAENKKKLGDRMELLNMMYAQAKSLEESLGH